MKCKAYVIPSIYNNGNCIEVAIILSICQSIVSVADVNVEVIVMCEPREDLNDEDCKPDCLSAEKLYSNNPITD
jgi:hypothetical protein